eukprot:5396337-Prymnesium_polylepis.1
MSAAELDAERLGRGGARTERKRTSTVADGGSIGRGKRGWSGGVWEQMVWVMERRWHTVGNTVGH